MRALSTGVAQRKSHEKQESRGNCLRTVAKLEGKQESM